MKKVFDIPYGIKYNAIVAAYMRYSSNNQDKTSIMYQRNAISTYALNRGYFVAAEYIDEARTGTNDRREGLQQMIADARAHPKWNKILVYDFSRFARNSKDSRKYTDELEDIDIELISVTQEIDNNSSDGPLMRGVINLLDEHYSRNLAKHIHAGMKLKAKDGMHCGGNPPLGYER